MELLDVALSTFTTAAPDYGASFLVHFQHVLGGFFLGKAKDHAEDHGHIAHEIHRVVMDNNIPRMVESGKVFDFGFGMIESRRDHDQAARRPKAGAGQAARQSLNMATSSRRAPLA